MGYHQLVVSAMLHSAGSSVLIVVRTPCAARIDQGMGGQAALRRCKVARRAHLERDAALAPADHGRIFGDRTPCPMHSAPWRTPRRRCTSLFGMDGSASPASRPAEQRRAGAPDIRLLARQVHRHHFAGTQLRAWITARAVSTSRGGSPNVSGP